MSATAVEKNSPLPYWHQLREILLGQIREGDLAPEAQLPGEHDLCRMYGVSRTVVRQAIGELERDGHVMRIRGRGTFVAPTKTPEEMFQSFSGLAEDVARRGGKLRSTVRRLETVPAAADIAEILAIEPGEPTIVLERLRYVNDDPWSVVTNHIPEALCPTLVDEDLSSQSLYELLEEKYGLTIARGRRSVEAIAAPLALARDLGVPRQSPLLLLRSTAYAADGRPIEHFVAYHRSDTTRFEVDLPRRHSGAAGPTLIVRSQQD